MNSGKKCPSSRIQFWIKFFILTDLPMLLSSCVGGGVDEQFFDSTVSTTALSSGASPNSGQSGGVNPLSNLNATPTPLPHSCDPLSDGTGDSTTFTTTKNGLKANLYYYDDAQLARGLPQQSSDFLQNGILAPADFFFRQLYTPTRAFDKGFALDDGSMITKSDGTPLFEYFSLRFKAVFKFPQGTATKNMQFAIISDDGAVLAVEDPVTQLMVTAINNDGTHGSKMGCGSSPIQISADTALPFELQYFQGPRFHIALILMWREWTGSSFDPNDPWCGQAGNSLYFDSTQTPSAPTAAWNDLMTRWQVVPPDVYFLSSDNSVDNPCQ